MLRVQLVAVLAAVFFVAHAQASCGCVQFFPDSPKKCINCDNQEVDNPQASLAVMRDGKWYFSDRSNMMWKRGDWVEESVGPHPTDPWLRKVAGQWIRKRATPARQQWVQNNGKWWKNSRSIEFYKNGHWVKARASANHPRNPWKVFRAGQWVRRSGDLGYVKIKGTWRQGPEGIKRHTIYLDGQWVVQASWKKANNPHYRWSKSKNTWVRRMEDPMSQFWVVRHGLWYRSRLSRFFYYAGKWHRDEARNRDPRWRARYPTPCLGDRACLRRKWKRLPRAAIKRSWVHARRNSHGPVWFQDISRQKVWWYGRWKKRVLTPREKARLARMFAKYNLFSGSAPIDLKDLANSTMMKYLESFLVWFHRHYLKSSRYSLPRRLGGSLYRGRAHRASRKRLPPLFLRRLKSNDIYPIDRDFPANKLVRELKHKNHVDRIIMNKIRRRTDPSSSQFDSYERILRDRRRWKKQQTKRRAKYGSPQ